MKDNNAYYKLDSAIYRISSLFTYFFVLLYAIPAVSILAIAIHKEPKVFILTIIIFPTVALLIDCILEKVAGLFTFIFERVIKIPRIIIKIITIIFNLISIKIIIVYIFMFCAAFDIGSYYLPEINEFSLYKEMRRNVNEIYDSYFKYDKFESVLSPLVKLNGSFVYELLESTDEISNKAKEITNGINGDLNRCKAIYTWIGENIQYDDNVAELLEQGIHPKASGAITAYKERKGVCLDFSSLYFVMVEALGYDVRLVVGDSIDMEKREPHAWNEVYIEDESRWINVDSTFYGSYDAFDYENFENTHAKEDIPAETKERKDIYGQICNF